ncbi:DMT family transporter [Saccharothrix obliqua]|uniref:DMT family transporter n=1 Tax=Saccharothrix obliqua TaxID=2861747 RepID=UPI001C5D433B|nr:DMT family transporter [Saccharothrix obliqua]MBW4718261.1 DMT family transporter [Saccharothrix obliqua]
MANRSVVRMAVLALVWGSGFLWIKLALTGLPPAWVAVIRCALGTAVLAGLAAARRERPPRDRTTWAHLVVAALFCNALPFLLFGIGQQTVDSGVAGVVNATTPLWSLLIGRFTGERGLTPARVAGLVLGFAGVLLIFAPWEGQDRFGWGVPVLVGAAASYAVAFAYMGRHLVGRGGPMAVSAGQMATATGLTALALPTAGPVHLNPTAVIAVVVLGVFGTGVTFFLNYRIIEDEGPTSAATVGYLLPVVSVALGALVLDEPLTLRTLAGMAVVLAGVALTRTTRTGVVPPPAPVEPARPDR